MSLILPLLAALAAMLAVGWAFSRMERRNAAQSARWALGVGGVLLGVLLTVRGLAVLGAPMIAAALGLLGVALRGGRRRGGDDGAEGGGERTRTQSSRGGMSVREAREVLGVGPDAGEDEIRAAYRTLMKQVHPDAGGTDALAARVREAYDVLTKAK
ncbi:molecular chaperone DnaJ [Marinicauda salina]|jgi:DnaJ-domain-containing protein 1|uniref:Molecular chaperone DnaJ n=1 Tax=Marinicauda salina TaxID=2135793 RepID=A0A2U2BR56_9PROT|nr:J domain-containing protein [Marinicauda salina]PWE16492.1 molecular chaperone DnaJ [Marinicauda salina]